MSKKLDINKYESELKELEQNLKIYKESIREISLEILNHKVSKYPIFIASKEATALGRMIIDKEELALEWSIFASTLEEFVAKKVVLQDKLDVFRKNYKNPETHVCIFAVLGDDASFIFTPYDEE